MDIALLESVAAAFITALATVYIGSRQMANTLKTEITSQEVKDRSEFRSQLMEQINSLRADLATCKEEHNAAHYRILRLEKVIKDHGIELVDL